MSRENVPSYDGTPETLPSYKEKAIQYAMTIEYHKRYLCGPRLLQSLTGVAKVITRSQTLKNPQWLSHPRCVYQLLEFLEEQLAKPVWWMPVDMCSSFSTTSIGPVVRA